MLAARHQRAAEAQRDKSILYDIAIDELGKLDAPAIKRAMQFMGIEEVYPNKKSRMCALGAAAGQPQQHRLSGVLTVALSARRLASRSSTASAARSRL